MAAAAVAMMIATSLVLIGIGSVYVGEAWEEANVIHVGGKVLCQDCTEGWNDWVNGSNPIKSMYTVFIGTQLNTFEYNVFFT